MKYRHYAPNTKCMMVYSKNEESMVNKINELISGKNALVVCRDKNFDKYATKNKIKMGSSLDEMAHNIFSILRQVDNYNVGMQKDGLGLALNNRLLRACEYNYIEI